jgi:hypothetical protein
MAKRIGVTDANRWARLVVLRYLDQRDPEGDELRSAAREVIASVGSWEAQSSGDRAALAECHAVLVGEALQVVRNRFDEGRSASIEVGPGWYQTVVDLDRQIHSAAPDARYVQIKQKCGGLCVYVKNGDRTVESLIEAAEREAARICESCGLPGILRENRGFVQTLCDVHAVGPSDVRLWG